MAVIYNSLMDKWLQELPPKTRRFWQSRKAAECPLCESEKVRDLTAVREFVRCWSESDKLRGAFSEKGILCLPHLEKALGQKMNASARKTLREAGEKALKRLIKDLNEFLEKQDYHRSQESLGKEWDAWIRAVRMVSGEKD